MDYVIQREKAMWEEENSAFQCFLLSHNLCKGFLFFNSGSLKMGSVMRCINSDFPPVVGNFLTIFVLKTAIT